MKKVAVVLGYRLESDGSINPILYTRLNLFLRLYKEEKIDKVILTGGPTNYPRPEALYMKEYLIANGVKEDIIIVETESISTIQNAKFCKPIIKELNPTNLVIVTTNDHLIRPWPNTIDLFVSELNDPNLVISCYTNATIMEKIK